MTDRTHPDGSPSPSTGPARVDLDAIAETLGPRLRELAERHQVPGAALSLGCRSDVVAVYAGAERLGGPEVSRQSVFEIGSVTKVWTATLVMQLVADGLLDLDARVIDVIPGFRVADPDLSDLVTVRHLLTHSGGFDGDLFRDTGEGGDALATYVADLTACSSIGALPGEVFSYCNAGVVVLGRIVELLGGTSFDEVLQRWLVDPLDLRGVLVDPGTSGPMVGLVTGYNEPGREPVPVAAMSRGMAPTGTRLSMTPLDLCRFGLAHATQDGRLGIDNRTLVAMQTPHVPVACGVAAKWGDARGLGWGIHQLENTTPGEITPGVTTMLAHNGHTIGQVTALRVFPEHAAALTVHASGGAAYALIDEIATDAVPALTGMRLPASPAPPASPVPIDVSPYLGRYRGQSVNLDLTATPDAELALTVTAAGKPQGAGPESLVTLRQVAPGKFVAVEDDMGEYPTWAFLLDSDGRATHITNGRTFPRQ